MIVYKFTDPDGWTRRHHLNGHNWLKEPVLKTNGEGNLCGPGWIHAYEHPALALFHDMLHSDYLPDALFFQCEAVGEIKRDGFLKLGTTKLIVQEQLTIRTVTAVERAKYASYAALEYIESAEIRSDLTKYLAGEEMSPQPLAIQSDLDVMVNMLRNYPNGTFEHLGLVIGLFTRVILAANEAGVNLKKCAERALQ